MYASVPLDILPPSAQKQKVRPSFWRTCMSYQKISVVAIETELYDVLGVSPTANGGMLCGTTTRGVYPNPRLSQTRSRRHIARRSLCSPSLSREILSYLSRLGTFTRYADLCLWPLS